MRDDSTSKYMHGLLEIKHATIKSKIVKCAILPFEKKKWNDPESFIESWYGNFVVDGNECYVVVMRKSLHRMKVPKGRKEKLVYKMKETGNFDIFCYGNDDFAMARRDIDPVEAEKIFDQIVDGTSKEELHFYFNLQYDW